MKPMRQRLFILLLLLCVLAASSAASVSSAAPTPIIQDDADLLTDAEEKELYGVMEAICEYGTPVLWTMREPGDYQSLADRHYRDLLGTSSGTMLVMNMYERVLTIRSNGAISRTITNAEADTITDNIYRYAGSGRYYECARAAFEQIGKVLRGERIARPMKLISNVLLAVTLALMIVYFYITARYEQHSTTKKLKTAVPVSVLSGAAFSAVMLNTQKKMTKQVKTDISSSSGSGSRGGGGFGGGGGGGGGGGSSGSHRF